MNGIFGNPPLQPPQKMLGVGFNNQLDIPVSAVFSGVDDINHHIGQSRLSTGVKMDFRLFHEDDRSWRCIETLNQHGQHLGDAKTHIRQIHPILRAFGTHLDFIFLPLFGDGLTLNSSISPISLSFSAIISSNGFAAVLCPRLIFGFEPPESPLQCFLQRNRHFQARFRSRNTIARSSCAVGQDNGVSGITFHVAVSAPERNQHFDNKLPPHRESHKTEPLPLKDQARPSCLTRLYCSAVALYSTVCQ